MFNPRPLVRLALCCARWACFALGVAFALGGCLFVGDLNERPTAQLYAVQTTTELGRALQLEVSVADDQRGARADLEVRDEHGAVVDASCVYRLSAVIGSEYEGGRTYELVFWRAGTYTVTVTPKDAYNASGSTAALEVTITNAAPRFAAAIDQLRIGQSPDACGAHHTARRPILLALRQEAVDPEASALAAPAGCPSIAPALEHRWKLATQPTGAGRLGLSTLDSCPPEPVGGAVELVAGSTVCLYPDPAISAAQASIYGVLLEIDDGAPDGQNRRSSTPLSIPVIGDAPACLDGVYPAAGAYVLPRDRATAFQALGSDDVDAAGTLGYVWSLARAGESEFTVIAPGAIGSDGGGQLRLDPIEHGFAVGEAVRLRVEVFAPATTVECMSTDDRCEVASCVALPLTTCPRRSTWALEYR